MIDRAWILVPLVACGSPKLTATGTITVNGEARAATGCEMKGSGVATRLVLALDDGAKLDIGVHGGPPSLERGGKPAVALRECSKQSLAGSGSSSSYRGTIALVCKGGDATLDLSLELSCGEPPPSNRSDRR